MSETSAPGSAWMRRAGLAIWFAPALWAGVAVLGLAQSALDPGAWDHKELSAARVVGSKQCLACHPSEHASWHRSWHRTMTQDLTLPGVQPLAPFEGERFAYGGFEATMERDEAGGLWVRFEAEGGARLEGLPPRVSIERSVGSHRYQQYLARIDRGGGDQEWWRLPIAWHRDAERWIHLNGAFVEPEGRSGNEASYLRHLSRWNDNCIFCHNTEPRPGIDEQGQFESRVGELGIACEACHAGASEHLERHRDPFRRLLSASLEGRAQGKDASIVLPRVLDSGTSSDICGRCHGQRIARDQATVLREGDPFVPGERLAEHSRPIFRDSELAGFDSGSFQPRFWPDGRPRLSAYEYQGLIQSPCYGPHEGVRGGGMGCGDCHTMHGSEADMQLREQPRDAACLSCHPSFAAGEAKFEHGGHREVAPSLDCLDCHMPRITYGLLEGMISHQVAVPDPARWIGRRDQPDACTQCHVDRDRGWAARSMSDISLDPAPGRASGRGDEALVESPEMREFGRVFVDLFGGDGIQRNLAAHALARRGVPSPLLGRLGALGEALDDEYPSVRWFAWRGLMRLSEEHSDWAHLGPVLARFDYLGPPERRIEQATAIRAVLPPSPFRGRPELRTALESLRDARPIAIGE